MKLDILLNQLSSDDDWEAIRAAGQLREFADKGMIRAIPHLLREMRYETRQADFDARIRGVWESGDKLGAIAMAEHLLPDLIGLRIDAIYALGKIKDASVVTALVGIMWNDKESLVRSVAAEALETIGSRDACEAVKAWRSRST